MMIVLKRKKVEEARFSWGKFSACFVTGGLPVTATSSNLLTAYLHRGFSPRHAPDEPRHRRGPNEWGSKFTYNWSRPVRSLVQLASSPMVLSYFDIQAGIAARLKRRRWRDYLALDLFLDAIGTAVPMVGQLRWLEFVLPWWNKLDYLRGYRVPKPNSSQQLSASGFAPAFRYVEMFRRPQKKKWRKRCRARSRRSCRYGSRWYGGGFKRTMQSDLLRLLLVWKDNVKPTSLGLRRSLIVAEDRPEILDLLRLRLRQLYRRQRLVAESTNQANAYQSHTEFVFTRIVQKVSNFRRRQLRYRRYRLQRSLSNPHSVKQWFDLINRSFFRRFKMNRQHWIETVKVTSPSQNYIFGLYYRAIRFINLRVGSSLEYTYLKKGTTYIPFTLRKKLRARRWRLGDHPTHKIPFREARAQRWGWFREGDLVKTTDETLQKKRETKETSTQLLDPLQPPLENGFFALTYWNLQEWGRGSRWRTRPLNRALTVFLTSVRSGHAYEYEGDQWSHAATSATGVKHSLLVEEELDLSQSTRKTIRNNSLLASTSISGQTFLLSKNAKSKIGWWLRNKPRIFQGVFALCFFFIDFLWMVFLLFWYPYSLVAQVFSLIFSFVRQLFYLVTLELMRFVCFVSILRVEWKVWKTETFAKFFFHSPWIKTVRWAYIAWIMVYSSADDAEETHIPATQEEQDDDHFAEEEEVTGNYGDDYEDQGSYPFQGEPFDFPGDTWFAKELDSFYMEGIEVAQEIFLEEVPSFFRLLFRPIVDLVIFLPLWGFLDGLTTLTAAVKLDAQKGWRELLTRGNKIDPATRKTTFVAGRWWKWPLVGLRLGAHWIFTFAIGSYLAGQATPASIKFWVTYSIGLPYQEEYYLIWLLLSWGGAIWLVGPSSLRGYLFHEIGLSNLFFLLIGSTSLTFPEEYYPHRAASPMGREWISRTNLFYHKVNYMDTTELIRGRPLLYGLNYTDEFRLTLAQLRAYSEYFYEMELDDGPSETALVFPHLDELVTFENHYPQDPLRIDLNLERRHPTFTRSNFYDIHFATTDEPSDFFYPYQHYAGTTPRNHQIHYSGNQSEIGSNFGPQQ
jgi:hypothetical protein